MWSDKGWVGLVREGQGAERLQVRWEPCREQGRGGQAGSDMAGGLDGVVAPEGLTRRGDLGISCYANWARGAGRLAGAEGGTAAAGSPRPRSALPSTPCSRPSSCPFSNSVLGGVRPGSNPSSATSFPKTNLSASLPPFSCPQNGVTTAMPHKLYMGSREPWPSLDTVLHCSHTQLCGTGRHDAGTAMPGSADPGWAVPWGHSVCVCLILTLTASPELSNTHACHVLQGRNQGCGTCG